MNIDDVVKDFKRLKKYLHIPDFELELLVNTNESFCYVTRKKIALGVKDGYHRTDLVHECLHAVGIQHFYNKNYSGDIKADTFSDMMEKLIFIT